MTSQLEHNYKRFTEASALVLAASDLLQAASSRCNGQLVESLDDHSLQNLAEAIHREAQVAEILYTQLHEIFEQSRSEHIALYKTQPQIVIPLCKLTLTQLQQLITAGDAKLDTLESNTIDSGDNPNQPMIEGLRRKIDELHTEMAQREQAN